MEKLIKTSNGVDIYTYKNPSLHGFYISLFLKCGAMHESERDSGITHFLEHVLIRNVNKVSCGELYSTLDRYGLEFNASSYAEMVQFYTSGSSENFSHSALVITELLKEISLSPEEIEAERKRIKAEIREGEDKSSLSYLSQINVFSGSSLSRSITGSLGCISKISKRRLEEYRKRVFTRENIFFYVTGNFTDLDIENLSSLIAGYSIGESEKIDNVAPVPHNFLKRPKEIIVKNADFTSVRFNFDIDMSRVGVPEVDLLYDMLFSGYNSAFFIEMSEKRGLFYDVTAQSERYKNIGTLSFSFEVKGRELYEAVRLSAELLEKYKRELMPEDKCMKAGYVQNSKMLLDDIRELNFTMAYDSHIMDLGYKSLSERSMAYESITPEKIKSAAEEIFKRENLTLVIKGKKKKISNEKIEEALLSLK